MLNHICVAGRLVRDPEIRHTGNGIPVVSFALAVDRDRKNDNGERDVDFIDVVAFRSTAEFVNSYFTKGRKAIVSGRLQIRAWTDNDGNKRRNAEIVAENVYFGDSKKESSDSYGSYSAPAYSEPPAQDFAMLSGEDESLPF